MRKIKILPAAVSAVIALTALTACADREKPELVMNSPVPAELSGISYISTEPDLPDKTDMPEKYVPLTFGEQRAVWLTYIEIADMLSEESCADDLRRDSRELFSRLRELGLNTVYLHVRAFGDALYPSELFAPSKYLTFDCDPLAVMLETAHAEGLAVHAWVNPLRCENSENISRSEGTLIGQWYADPERFPEYIVQPADDPHFWLDPAVPEVRRLAADGVSELCRGYDIDGVHIDDYFYPTQDESFDAQQYARNGGGMSLADWRRENCTLLVKELYSAVKAADPALPFSVSPQGNQANNFDKLYADVERWCREDGCLDCVVPQIYFGYDNAVCPFAETLAEWERTAAGKTLVVGIGMYKAAAGGELSGGEYSGVFARQIRDVLDSPECGGFALYSCSSLLDGADPALIGERAAISAALEEYD